ncbi:MAG TPA: aminotransferase class I/II-fold pyridoxal phosphate-dependent enzyme [Syntrophomonadaceae bacterium]|nr:aminotransferase class I/II-fold pyridoxal phosphate-dependent enzyme [Syntrophomonadaceae bacterium]
MSGQTYRDPGAPIFSALLSYLEEGTLRLHMPGHIGGRGMPEIFQNLAALDVTEVPGTDDLHCPREAIEEGRRLMAQAFGAKESFFLVNGASSGIHCLLLSLPNPEGKVLVPRNSHRSFWGGFVLSGAFPIYIPCGYEPQAGIALAVESADIARLLHTHPESQAVFITSPNYYGATCKINDIAAVVREQKKILLVDEAHGGHFPFHPAYPRAALHQGADGVVNGLHKTLPVLNQGACLHVGPGFKHRDRLFSAYSLLTTTSPSYPLLASMDKARQLMVEKGYDLLEAARELALDYREKINRLPGLRVLDQQLLEVPGVEELDPLKTVIFIEGLSLTGYQLSELLRTRYHIQVELQEPRIVLAMMSMFHRKEEWEELYQSLKEVCCSYQGPFPHQPLMIPPFPQVVLSPRQAFGSTRRRVKLQDSAGRLCGELVAVYPPGIPCLLPGEMIDAEMLDYLWYIKKSGSKIQGPDDPEFDTIMILDEISEGRHE